MIVKYDDNWLLKVLKLTKGYNNSMSINILKFIIKLYSQDSASLDEKLT